MNGKPWNQLNLFIYDAIGGSWKRCNWIKSDLRHFLVHAAAKLVQQRLDLCLLSLDRSTSEIGEPRHLLLLDHLQDFDVNIVFTRLRLTICVGFSGHVSELAFKGCVLPLFLLKLNDLLCLVWGLIDTKTSRAWEHTRFALFQIVR